MRAKNDAKGGRVMAGYIDATLSWADLVVAEPDRVADCAEGGYGCRGSWLVITGGIWIREFSYYFFCALFPWLTGLRLALRLFCSQGKEKGKGWCAGKRRKAKACRNPNRLTAPPSSPPALLTLPELHCLCPHVFDSLEVAMHLVGVTDLAQCHPGLVSTLEIDHLVPSTEGIRMRERGRGRGRGRGCRGWDLAGVSGSERW